MSLSSLAPVIVVADDGVVAAPSNPAGRARRRTFTPTQKLKYLSEYEAACETGQGNAYLRGEGLYSSLMTEWRRLRDAGVLGGRDPGEPVGRPSREWADPVSWVRSLCESSCCPRWRAGRLVRS